MVRFGIALASGALFGVGLVVSRMIDPAKVLGFLDLAGNWDPSLAFVMLGGLIVAVPAYAFGRRMDAPLCAAAFAPPARSQVDRRLIAGAIVFGIGWGLVGYCPGPALASLMLAGGRTTLFVVAMLIGMATFTAINRDRAPSVPRRSTSRQPSANGARPRIR